MVVLCTDIDIHSVKCGVVYCLLLLWLWYIGPLWVGGGGAEEGKINICLVWDHRIGLGNNQANRNYTGDTVNNIFHLTHGLLLLWLILS